MKQLATSFMRTTLLGVIVGKLFGLARMFTTPLMNLAPGIVFSDPTDRGRARVWLAE